MKRNPSLSTQTPESCSLSRSTAFNKHNTQTFFANLKEVYDRHPSFADGSRTFNLDETSTTTVQKPRKVVAEKGQKQVSQVVSSERGQLVTTCCIINALGSHIRPIMVFP